MKVITTPLLLIAVLAGCASNPDKIDAAYVSPLKYKNYDCDQIALEMDYIGQRTTKIYQRLKSERNADNWQMGIGLVVFWPALFFLEGGDGPEASEYAQLTGEFEALRDTSIQKKCEISSKSPEEIMKEAQEADKEDAKKGNESETENSDEESEIDEVESIEPKQVSHKLEVDKIAEAMSCDGPRSLKKMSRSSETWNLDCGDDESLTVECVEGTCYIRD